MNILKKKWHLHSLTTPAAMLVLALVEKYPNFMDIGKGGNALKVFVTLLAGAVVAGLIEYYQGVKGANRTELEVRDSNKDFIVSMIMCGVGIILHYTFGFNSILIISLLVVISVMELLRLLE